MGFVFLVMFGVVSFVLVRILDDIKDSLDRIANILEVDIEQEEEEEEDAKTKDSN